MTTTATGQAVAPMAAVTYDVAGTATPVSAAAPLPVTASGTGATADQVQGNIAHDAVDSGNPVKMGGKAKATAPTAVTADGDRVDAWFGMRGQQATMPTDASGNILADGNGAVVQCAAQASQFNAAPVAISNSTTGVTLKAAAGASIRNYITAIQISWTAHTNTTDLLISDGAGGTTLLRPVIAGATGNLIIPFAVPLRGTANTLVEARTVVAGGAGSIVYISAQGFTSTL